MKQKQISLLLLLFEVVTDKQVFSTQGNTFKGDKISKGMCFYFLCLLNNLKLFSTGKKNVIMELLISFIFADTERKREGN